MQLAEKLKITPFARILPLFVLGILIAGYVSAPTYIVITVTAAVYFAAWRFKTTAAGPWYISAAMVLTGILITSIALTEDKIPRGEKVYIIAEVTKAPYSSGRWQRTTAQVGYFRPVNQIEISNASQDDKTEWTATNETIELYIDTCYNIMLGEQIAASAYLNPIDTTGSRYGALMRSRGINSRAYVVPSALIARMDAPKRSILYYSGVMQDWMIRRIGRLSMNDESKSMVETLVAGSRTTLDRNLKAAYSNVGAAHILSVSGLHMGFVFIFINILFGWMSMFRRGHIAKNIIVIIAIWLYAMCAGISPPVVRAALMLSAAQVALWGSVQGNGYNIILACAMFMLAVNPFYLFDVSFQLSFIAVLSIIFFYPRLYRRVLSGNKTLDFLWSTILIGVAAQIGTMPLVAYNFSSIPLISVIINPVMVFTSFFIIIFGLIWVFIPLGFLNPFLSAVLEFFVDIQNKTVLWADSSPAASIGNIHVTVWGAVVFYIILGAIALTIKMNEERNEPISIFHRP